MQRRRLANEQSNAKQLWANTKPMDAEVRMVTQAAATKGKNPDGHVWVYRNLVKALPWFETVREKLLDPAYSSWFLKYDPAKKGNYSVATGSDKISAQCDENYDPPICSDFYHDQEQTPAHGEAKPDGKPARRVVGTHAAFDVFLYLVVQQFDFSTIRVRLPASGTL